MRGSLCEYSVNTRDESADSRILRGSNKLQKRPCACNVANGEADRLRSVPLASNVRRIVESSRMKERHEHSRYFVARWHAVPTRSSSLVASSLARHRPVPIFRPAGVLAQPRAVVGPDRTDRPSCVADDSSMTTAAGECTLVFAASRKNGVNEAEAGGPRARETDWPGGDRGSRRHSIARHSVAYASQHRPRESRVLSRGERRRSRLCSLGNSHRFSIARHCEAEGANELGPVYVSP